MTFNSDTDPVCIDMRRQTREFIANLKADMERLRNKMTENTQSRDNPAATSRDAEPDARNNNGGENGDTTIQDIEAPFQLSANDIVEAVEQDSKTVIHNVMAGERVLFSTVSRPLAHAFVQGYNAKAQSTGAAEEDDDSGEKRENGTGEQNKTIRRGPVEADPVKLTHTEAGAGEKVESADAGNQPAPKKSPPSDTSGSQPGNRRSERADAAPRKRAVL